MLHAEIIVQTLSYRCTMDVEANMLEVQNSMPSLYLYVCSADQHAHFDRSNFQNLNSIIVLCRIVDFTKDARQVYISLI